MKNFLLKYIEVLGWIASIMGICMFVSYFDQIRLNLAGIKGSLILPIITFINCFLWLIYSSIKSIRPILYANIIGCIVSMMTVISWFIGDIPDL